MGEPTPQSYKRHFDFPFWPVKSASELADYAEWLIDLVTEESGVEPEVKLNAKLFGRDQEPPIPLSEFRERFDEFPFDKFFEASLDAWTPDGNLTLEFRMISSILGPNTATVTVTGTDKEAVQRTKTKVREEGEARLESERRAKAKAKAGAAGAIFEAEAKRERERQHAAPRKKPSRVPEPPAPAAALEPERSRFKRFIYNPWTITVGATVLGSVIYAAIDGL